MTSLKLRSWAKVNLSLDVLGVRNDGYHELDSVVQVIDLFDELEFQSAPAGVAEVTSNMPWLQSGSGNTIWQAGQAFIRKTGIRGGFRCRLEKRIPARSGLGGGSGDAAATISALDALYDTRLSEKSKVELAAEVGSDAALFVLGGTVRMRGRGEIVEPLPDAPALTMVVVKPEEGVSTPEAYRLLDQSQREMKGSSQAVAHAVIAGDAPAMLDAMWNDFDPVIADRLEMVRLAKLALVESGARKAMLTGSGSAVFGIFDDAGQAAQAVERLSGAFHFAAMVRSLTRRESCLSEVVRGDS